MLKIKSLLASRRFWVSAIGLIAVCSSELLGMEINQAQMIGIATIIAAWVIGDTVRETN